MHINFNTIIIVSYKYLIMHYTMHREYNITSSVFTVHVRDSPSMTSFCPSLLPPSVPFIIFFGFMSHGFMSHDVQRERVRDSEEGPEGGG